MEQRVTEETTHHYALLPMVEGVKQHCGDPPQKGCAYSRFFGFDRLEKLEKQKVDVYVPDSNLARVLNQGGRLRGRASGRCFDGCGGGCLVRRGERSIGNGRH